MNEEAYYCCGRGRSGCSACHGAGHLCGTINVVVSSTKTDTSGVSTTYTTKRSDNYTNTSVIGFRGTEDLGKGSKHRFISMAVSVPSPFGCANNALQGVKGIHQFYNFSDSLHLEATAGGLNRYARRVTQAAKQRENEFFPALKDEALVRKTLRPSA